MGKALTGEAVIGSDHQALAYQLQPMSRAAYMTMLQWPRRQIIADTYQSTGGTRIYCGNTQKVYSSWETALKNNSWILIWKVNCQLWAKEKIAQGRHQGNQKQVLFAGLLRGSGSWPVGMTAQNSPTFFPRTPVTASWSTEVTETEVKIGAKKIAIRKTSGLDGVSRLAKI